jgi:hypothetical protein
VDHHDSHSLRAKKSKFVHFPNQFVRAGILFIDCPTNADRSILPRLKHQRSDERRDQAALGYLPLANANVPVGRATLGNYVIRRRMVSVQTNVLLIQISPGKRLDVIEKRKLISG